MTEIKRKKGESFEAMVRRFRKRMQQSGKLLQAKQRRYYEKEANKNFQRKNKLHKLKVKKQKEYLEKTGQLEEDTYNRRR